MADNPTSDWSLPVSFYFSVEFQNMNGQRFQASFSEVSGLGWNYTTTTKETDSAEKQEIITAITHPNLILKRPLDTTRDEFSAWVRNFMRAMLVTNFNSGVKKHKVCDVVIKLLDSNGKPVAAWSCNQAYPIKFEVSGFNSGRAELAMETIELVHNRIERVL